MNIPPNRDILRRQQTDLVKGYIQWMYELQVVYQYSLYFLTFLYDEIPFTGGSRRNEMQKEIYGYYRMHLSHCERNPNSPAGKLNVPRVVAYPDLPVPKIDKMSIRDAAINGGLHCHAIEAVPPTARLSRQNRHLTDLIYDQGSKYIAKLRFMRQIECEMLDFNRDKFTKYLLKSYLRGYHTEDDVLILPKSMTEIEKRRFLS